MFEMESAAYQEDLKNVADDAPAIPHQGSGQVGAHMDDSFSETLLSMLPFGMDIVDMTGTIVFINPAFANMAGHDAVGRKCWEVYRDDGTRCHGCPLLSGFHDSQCEKVTSRGMLGGKTFIISHSPFVYRGEQAVMKLFHDVTDDLKQQAELLDSKVRVARIVEGIDDIIYSMDAGTLEYTFLSPVYEKVTGYTMKDISEAGGAATFLAKVLGQDDYEALKQDFLDLLKESHAVRLVKEWWLKRIDGTKVCFEDRWHPVFQDGRLIRLDGVLRDITDRKKAENALTESEDRYRNLFDLAPDAIFVVHGVAIQYVNSAGLLILGGESEEQIVGRALSHFVHPEYLSICFDDMEGSQIPKKELPLTECRFIRLDGSEIEIELVATAFVHNDREAVQIVARDISARKHLESMIIMKEKLADLGTLAAGVAHEINSPLQVITGVTQSLSKRIDKNEYNPEHFKRELEVANRNAWRCASIARALLTYSRPAVEDLESYQPNELVKEALLLIEHQLKSWSNVFIHTKLEDGLTNIRCNRNQLIQVVLNLLTNARDAMPDGGDISIESWYDKQTRRVVIQIEDAGTGIPDHFQEKIFNPFFTTKPFGKGTGLGLSISLGIAKSFGGDLRLIRSGPTGTAIAILIPELNVLPLEPAAATGGGRYDEQAHSPLEG